MGLRTFIRNKIKDYAFLKNKKQIQINHFELDFFETFNFENQFSGNDPKVSIIIPVYNQIRFTLNCLYSIYNQNDGINKEIIIINDNSTDETHHFLSKIKGIQLIENAENLGFLKSVNKGIELAKGEYIYLLNNDTEIQKNYLTSLLSTFKTKGNVGAVGSKMIYANGSLQEAGCLIFKDAHIVNLGRQRSIEQPDYNYLKKVDYCSGCSLLFKKHTREGKLNLLDKVYAPAYYEETDLCMKLKFEQGLDVYYQPQSEIIHFENISYNGINTNKSSLMHKNETIFKQRWNHHFINPQYFQFENKGYLNINAMHKSPSVLLLEDLMPQYDKDSGSNRFTEIVKILIKNNHKVYLGVAKYNKENDEKYTEYFQQLGVEVLYDYVNHKNKLVKVDAQLKKLKPYVDVIWIFRPEGFRFWHKQIKKYGLKAKLIYDMVDLHYLRLQRENDFFKKSKKQIRKNKDLKNTEFEAMRLSDAVVAISNKENDIIVNDGIEQSKIHIVSNIHIPKKTIEDVPFNERQGLLFIGSFNHKPNVDSVLYLRNEIMPLIWQKNQNIKAYILGGGAPEEIQKLHDDTFQILGYQKEIDYWFEHCKIFVAPLRYGAGVKGKIGQALEYALPIVTTPIGVEGMQMKHGVHAIVADVNTPDDFAAKILQLYSDETLWNFLRENSNEALFPFSIAQQEKTIINLLKTLHH